MASKHLLGKMPEVAEWLERIGIDKPNEVSRVIIDIPFDGMVVCYVERFATRKLIEFSPADISDTEIKIVEIDEGASDTNV